SSPFNLLVTTGQVFTYVKSESSTDIRVSMAPMSANICGACPGWPTQNGVYTAYNSPTYQPSSQALQSDQNAFYIGPVVTYNQTTLQSMGSVNLTWGTQFNITVPGLVRSGDYIMAEGLILDVNNRPISGYMTNMTVTYANGTPLPNNVGVGPSYNATNGNFLSIMTTTYLAPGNYYVTIGFTDTVNGVLAKKSWPVAIGNAPTSTTSPGGPVPQVYADGVIYYNFFDNNTGFGLNPDFYKLYVSNTYYIAVKDYFGHMVWPPPDLASYSCTGANGEACPFSQVTSTYGVLNVVKPQLFLDVGVTLYQVKIKNTQTDPAYLPMSANGKTYATWVLPGEITSLEVPQDTYALQTDIYDANLQPPQLVDYAYNYTGSTQPYWMPSPAQDTAGDGSLCLQLSCTGQPANTGVPGNGVTGNGAACLDGAESTVAYCSAANATAQGETLAYFGTLDLNRVSKLTNLTLHLWDGDARSFYGYRVETSADPVHNGWSLLWDSTQNGCAGGGLATRVGPTMPGSAGGVCTSANVDYQGRQVLSFSPQDVRYVRVFLTGSTASSAGLLTEVLAGASASASLLVNQDQFIWIRGYDLFSVVFLINNVASQVYNQQVN